VHHDIEIISTVIIIRMAEKEISRQHNAALMNGFKAVWLNQRKTISNAWQITFRSLLVTFYGNLPKTNYDHHQQGL